MTQSWRRWKLGLACSLAISLGSIASSGDRARAQITPDNTLGSQQNSTVTSIGSVDLINGGASRGANLFHSFLEFNVDSGRSAFFTNPVGIENILSRVTGGNPSNILGTLGVTGGNANLFLINPNGIIFGPNASLNLNGSFVATTANAIGLASGDIFSANPGEPLPTALLNVNPSAFLFNQIAAQAIVNRSTASSTGLQVLEGKSILLVGGDVSLEGGRLLAPGGRVDLGGVAGSGTVELSVSGSYLGLSFPIGAPRADVSLTNGASVDVSAAGSGSIALNARNLDISGGSRLRANINSGLGSVETQAGNISLTATEAIAIANDSDIASEVRPQALGNGGSINITTGSLSVTNGAQLRTSTNGQGNAGSVNINARELVRFEGLGSNGRSSAAVSPVEAQAVGNGGQVNIKARSVSVTNGGQLGASTRGRGHAGSVNINARELVHFDGVAGVASNDRTSGAFSIVADKAEGKGGSININAGSLLVTNGAQLDARTRGQGDAGNVNIHARSTVSLDGVNSDYERESAVFSRVDDTGEGKGGEVNIKTGSLSVTNGAQIGASTRGQGDGGSVNITARDTVSFDGVNSIGGKSSAAFNRVAPGAVGNGGSINIKARSLSVTNGAQLAATALGQGDAGSITITARDIVSLTTAAQLVASSVGSGAAGNIEVAAPSIRLENQAFLSSNTTAGQGNIFLRSQDLVLRRGSNITTKATGIAEGGNITVDTGVIAALENSDISANAQDARGGRIVIKAQGIFGTKFREAETLESDITATSDLGPEFSGTVEINTPDVDPSLGIVALPAELVDASRLIASGCGASGRLGKSEFIVTGRGGLPPNPSDTLSSDTVWSDLRTFAKLPETRPRAEEATQPNNSTSRQLVEAQGWVTNDQGEVVLTATTPTLISHSPLMTPSTCH